MRWEKIGQCGGEVLIYEVGPRLFENLLSTEAVASRSMEGS